MRLLFLIALFGFVLLVTAKPASVGDEEEPNVLWDVVDVGQMHSNAADRQARHWGGGWGGWGGGYGGGWRGGYGGGWGGPRYGGARWGSWGGPRWGGWGGYGWGGGYWG